MSNVQRADAIETRQVVVGEDDVRIARFERGAKVGLYLYALTRKIELGPAQLTLDELRIKRAVFDRENSNVLSHVIAQGDGLLMATQ